MTRGRAGLWMIPAADVRAAIARHGHESWTAARDFKVSERTVRRWMRTGLPLCYGETNVTQDEWQGYVDTGWSGRAFGSKPVRRRTGGDRNLSRLGAADPGDTAGRNTVADRRDGRPRPPFKRKRLRRSRELLEAYRKLRS